LCIKRLREQIARRLIFSKSLLCWQGMAALKVTPINFGLQINAAPLLRREGTKRADVLSAKSSTNAERFKTKESP
jgi:hypothetical protein